MNNYSAAFRSCLERLDIAEMRKLWRHVSPHLPQPGSDEAVLISMHHARTQAQSIPFKMRAYSHRWLTERAFPSGLPDELRPSAERLYPKVVKAVGIAVATHSEFLRPIAEMARHAMENAVLEAHADGRIGDTEFVKARMMEARAGVMKRLLGV